jgi:recombinational DNA repair protein RecR
VAQNRLPDVDFTQHEKTVFSQVDEKIDELEVMEILLAVDVSAKGNS